MALSTGKQKYYDLSYLLNTSLWDQYYFSTVDDKTSIAPSSILPNQRLKFSENTPSNYDSLYSASDISGAGIFRNLYLKGAFNVNSTSVNSWIALLSGAQGIVFGSSGSSNQGVPFPRTVNPFLDSKNADNGEDIDSFAGYRRLTEDQIAELATAIVSEIKRRGPFVSLSHFINRSLQQAQSNPFNYPQAFGLMGVIQAAIDNSSINRLSAFKSGAVDGDWITLGSQSPEPLDNPMFADGGKDFSSLSNPNSPSRSAYGNRSTAIPGWITQADILQTIGPALSARSDTFRIRVMGQSPENSGKGTRLFLEAVVQRRAEYVDELSNDATVAYEGLSPVNQLFGRKFRIISVKEISADQI